MHEFPSNSNRRGIENSSTENKEKYFQLLLEKSKEQIEQLKPFLNQIMDLIEKEKPDYLVFMDKGARVFANPFKRALTKHNGYAPSIIFLNDHFLQSMRNEQNPESENLNISDLVPNSLEMKNELEKRYKIPEDKFKDKKIFFIDETMFMGSGAAIIDKLCQSSEVKDYLYIAMSKANPLDLSQYRKKQAEIITVLNKEVERLKLEGKVLINENFVVRLSDTKDLFEYNEIFSRAVGRLYVEDDLEAATKRAKSEVPNKRNKIVAEVENAIYESIS